MVLNFPDTPSDGDIYEQYKYNATDDVWNLNLPEYVGAYDFEYLVIAGGGGGQSSPTGSSAGAGGGGAGGYRSSVVGESSGGGASAETAPQITIGTYTVTVGAGGTGASAGSQAGSETTRVR